MEHVVKCFLANRKILIAMESSVLLQSFKNQILRKIANDCL